MVVEDIVSKGTSYSLLYGPRRERRAAVGRERLKVDIDPLEREEALGPQRSSKNVETCQLPVSREPPLGETRSTAICPVFDPVLKRSYGVSKLIEISTRQELSLLLDPVGALGPALRRALVCLRSL